MKFTLLATAAIAFFVGVFLGTTHWQEAPTDDSAASVAHSSSVAAPAKSAVLVEPKNVSPGPTANDLQRARKLREAATVFDSSLTIQQATVLRLRSKASELELRLFGTAFDEAEALFAAGHQIAADTFAKADATEAGTDTISDAWLTQMQNRTEQLELKLRRLSARLP